MRAGPIRPCIRLLAFVALIAAAGGGSGVAASPKSIGVPLYFEPNAGQFAPEFDFIGRAGTYTVGFSASEVTVASAGDDNVAAWSRMRLVGSDPEARPAGRVRLRGVSNYLRGSKPEDWIREVPHFAEVVYPNVYPGIDWVFGARRGAIAYDFVVAPGADPRRVRWRLEGVEDLRTDEAGNLVAAVEGQRLVHSAPLIFQAEDDRRQHVGGGFVLEPCDACGAEAGPGVEIGIQVDEYDHTRPLIIDPAIGFSTYLGGMASEDLPRIALGADGSAFVVGTTASPDFVTTGDVVGVSPAGGGDVFVAKLDGGGSGLIFSTFIGGGGLDRGGAIAVDAEGRAWLTGLTTSPDFPVVGGLQEGLAGPADAFVMRLSRRGEAIEYATLFGGSGTESGSGIAVDGAGGVWISGTTDSPDYPTLRPLQAELGGPSDAYVARLDGDGELSFSTFLGGRQSDTAFGIAVGASGEAVVTGSTESAAFPRLNPLQPEYGGQGDAFVVKLDGEAPGFVYATTLGGSGADAGLAVAVGPDGSAYVTGQTTSADFPTRNALQPRAGGSADAFVTKLSPQGDTAVYSTFLGGEATDVGGGIAVDGSGNAHVTGMTASADFPTHDSLQPFFGGGADVFVSRINDAGSGFSYSTYSGGDGAEAGIGIAVDGAGNAYVVGQTSSTDFPTFNPVQGELRGPQDAFVTKYCLSLIFPSELEFGSREASDRVTVTTAAGCAWLAFSEASWISLTTPNAVAGSGEVGFTIAPNPTGAERRGTINVGGATFAVLQRAAEACDARISPPSENFYMVGGVGRINVETTEDCAWTAVSTVDWISIQGGERGVGDGVVSYTVQMNGTGRARAGSIIVAGLTFVVFDWIREPLHWP